MPEPRWPISTRGPSSPMPPAAGFECDTLGRDRDALRRSLSNGLVYSMGKDPITATTRDWFNTTAHAVRERLIERWMETMRSYYRSDAKRVYYLSMEFLTGRLLSNSLLNMGFYRAVQRGALGPGAQRRGDPGDRAGRRTGQRRAWAGWRPASSIRWRHCRCRATATASDTSTACSRSRSNRATRSNNLTTGCATAIPGSFHGPRSCFPVKFGGRVVEFTDELGQARFHWVDTDEVMAMAFDTPVPGYDTGTVNNMRLWSAKASRDFNLKLFNEGNYLQAVQEKNESENLSKVLYPDDRDRERTRASAASSSTSSSAPRSRTSCGDTPRTTTVSRTSPIASRSSSTTRIRRSRSPS